MKMFFAALGAIFLLVLLLLVGRAYYAFHNAEAGFGKIAKIETDQFLATHHPSPHVSELLLRIENSAKLAKSLKQSTLALTALSVLTLPDAVTAPQEAMLEEAASMLDKPDLSFPEVHQFREKYKDVLPKRDVQYQVNGVISGERSNPKDTESVEEQLRSRIKSYKMLHQIDQKTSDLFAKIQKASTAAKRSPQTDAVMTGITDIFLQSYPMSEEQQTILDEAAGLFENPSLTMQQGEALFHRAMAAHDHQRAAHQQNQNAHPPSR